MEKALQSGVNEEEIADHVAITSPLLQTDAAGASNAAVIVQMDYESGDKSLQLQAAGAAPEESVDHHHDEPVDAVGGDGEFAVVAKSGLPTTSPSETEKGAVAVSASESAVEYNLDVPAIARQISVISGKSVKSLSPNNVEFKRGSSIPHKKHGLQGLSERKKHAVGICLIMVHCLTIVGSNQFAKLTYSKDFSAPFLLVYIRTTLRISIFPVFMLLKYIHRWIRHKNDPTPISFTKTFTSSTLVFGPQGLTLKTFLYPCGLLSILWVVVQTAHVFAAKFLNNSIITALFCSETAFSYVLSALILESPVFILKVTAVAVALVGVSLTAFSQIGGQDDLRWEGIVICFVGAILGSGYMVAVKKTLGKTEDVGHSLLLTSAMSLFVTTTCWPIVLGLYFGGWEYYSLETFPWSNVAATSSLTLVSVSVFNLSLTLTSPLLMTLSKLMGIPVNYAIDSALYSHVFDVYQIIGVILIGFGFIFIALPERWLAIKGLVRRFRRQTSLTPATAATGTVMKAV